MTQVNTKTLNFWLPILLVYCIGYSLELPFRTRGGSSRKITAICITVNTRANVYFFEWHLTHCRWVIVKYSLKWVKTCAPSPCSKMFYSLPITPPTELKFQVWHKQIKQSKPFALTSNLWSTKDYILSSYKSTLKIFHLVLRKKMSGNENVEPLNHYIETVDIGTAFHRSPDVTITYMPRSGQ